MSTSHDGNDGHTGDRTARDATREDHPMSGQNPDPAETAGLEPGGSIVPGDTPPDSTSAAGPSHEPPQRTRTPAIVFLVAVGVVVVLIVLGVVGRIAGLV